eukprot:jgi/Chlat1/2672/Chrsp18S02979
MSDRRVSSDNHHGSSSHDQSLYDRWPARHSQIKDLLDLLDQPEEELQPLIVYGDPSTGKTGIVRDVLQHRGHQHAYVSLRACYKPSILYAMVLDQLERTTNKRAQTNRSCNSLKDFCAALPKVTDSERAAYIIIDDVSPERELFEEEFKGLLSRMLKLQQLCGRRIAIILLTRDKSCVYSEEVVLEMEFGAYTREEVERIVTIYRPQGESVKLYREFVRLFLTLYFSISRTVRELLAAADRLYKVYASVGTVQEVSADAMIRRNRQFLNKAKEHVRDVFFFSDINEGLGDYTAFGTPSTSSLPAEADGDSVGFDLPVYGQYLLLAAFIASRNDPALDVDVFGAAGCAQKRRKRAKAVVAERQKREANAQMRKTQVYASFPMARLIAIYQALLAAEQDDHTLSDDELSPLVFVSVRELLALNLLCCDDLAHSGSDELLTGTAQLRFNATPQLVAQVAKSLHVELHRYLPGG